MRRAITLLMMVVMVLAPCAVARAASSTSHHAGMTLANSGAGQEAHPNAAPIGSHKQHRECDSGHHSPEHSACSSSCDVLQRVTLQNTGDRVSADFEKSWFVVAGMLDDAILAVEPEPASTPHFRPVILNQDSESVLRKTARLRL